METPPEGQVSQLRGGRRARASEHATVSLGAARGRCAGGRKEVPGAQNHTKTQNRGLVTELRAIWRRKPRPPLRHRNPRYFDRERKKEGLTTRFCRCQPCFPAARTTPRDRAQGPHLPQALRPQDFCLWTAPRGCQEGFYLWGGGQIMDAGINTRTPRVARSSPYTCLRLGRCGRRF